MSKEKVVKKEVPKTEKEFDATGHDLEVEGIK